MEISILFSFLTLVVALRALQNCRARQSALRPIPIREVDARG